VQAGDLVNMRQTVQPAPGTNPPLNGLFHLLEMYRNPAPRLKLLCLLTGETYIDVRPSAVEVLS
tara:strand:+ start:586 stop:777 length:192 start_codon:yes stop_codon:yes gene_type:complete